MLKHLDTSLLEFRSGLTPDQLREVEREQARTTYLGLIEGNAVGLAVALGLDDEEIETDLTPIVADCIKSAINDPNGRMAEKANRARLGCGLFWNNPMVT